MIDLSTISTDELVAELKTRHELCPVLDEMTRDPMCLFVTTTESLVKELSKKDEVIVPYPDLWFGIINNEIKCGKFQKILVVRE